ncbi:MAG: hypothetical protein H6R04_743 [Burkholderiaceae bacterium]|nr:hypothetical protein [Burkholderiaceae bacterium]
MVELLLRQIVLLAGNSFCLFICRPPWQRTGLQVGARFTPRERSIFRGDFLVVPGGSDAGSFGKSRQDPRGGGISPGLFIAAVYSVASSSCSPASASMRLSASSSPVRFSAENSCTVNGNGLPCSST